MAALDKSTEEKRKAATLTVEQLNAEKDKATAVRRQELKKKLQEAMNAAMGQPTTKSDADRVMKTGAMEANKVMRSDLAVQRDAAVGPLQAAASTEVSPSAHPEPETPALQQEPVGQQPAPVSADSVVPAPLPADRLDYSSDRGPTDGAMAESGVTQEQLAKGKEPSFGQALDARSAAEKHEAEAAGTYRTSEASIQESARAAAQTELEGGLAGMHGLRGLHVGQVGGKQSETVAKNAAERKRITEEIERIKNATRTDVGNILNSMDDEAKTIFEAGLGRAEKAYTAAFEKEIKVSIATWLTSWGDDWEDFIEIALAKARIEYLRQVDVAIDEVADCVDAKLEAARTRIADGRNEAANFVQGLGKSVLGFGKEALEAVSTEFDAMGSEIDQRRDALIGNLAQQYKASHERMAAMEEQIREENKSFWQRVYDATIGLIKKILAFKDMLVSILVKAAGVIGDIILDPIGFLGNLIDGVMLGLENFRSNIGTHLKKGLMEWLFGALSGAGITMPEEFDLQGIVSIVLQVLGLTYANFRARAVAIVGEPIVAGLEKAAEVFKVIATEGIGGLWRFIKEKLSDLKSMVLDAIFDFIKENVIVAGIKWVIGLLNPASAFFKACMAIYDIVKFFIERGSQILALVNAIIDSIGAIAKGSIGVAAKFIEDALAKAIPVAIGFLASLLGLGDISGTIRQTIEKAQTPVNKAIDWVINLAVKAVKGVGRLLGGKKEEPKTKEEHEDLGDAKNAAREAIHKRLGSDTSLHEAEEVLPGIEHMLRPIGLQSLTLGPEDSEGNRPILAEASLRRRIAMLIKKRIRVAVHAKITVDKAPVLEGLLRGAERTRSGRDVDTAWPAETLSFTQFGNAQKEALGTSGRAATLPAVSQPSRTPASHGDQPSGGVVVEPEHGSHELEILAWNTSQPERGHNVSHAEKQLVEWLWSRPGPWKERVTRVEIKVEGRPVCEQCMIDLVDLEKHLKSYSKDVVVRWTGDGKPSEEHLEVSID